jgi:hypothetical protein
MDKGFRATQPFLFLKRFCSKKGPGPLERGDNHKNVKIGLGTFKKSSSPVPLGQF